MESAEVCGSVAEAVADCTLVVGTTAVGHRALQHPLRRLEYGARLMRREVAAGGRVALLFGSERFGLSNEDMSHCHWLARIGTLHQEHSMNLGQAAAVCLWELVRRPAAARARPEPFKPAAAGETEQITARLLDALRRSGYVNPLTEGSTEEKVRRLVRRMNVSAHDAPVVLGMLRQILWKLGEGG
jgi:tRNA/rRNA methyltransferase